MTPRPPGWPSTSSRYDSGELDAREAGDLFGIDRVHLLRPVLAERVLTLHHRLGVAQRAVIVTVDVGGDGMVGTFDPQRAAYPRSTNTTGPPSTANGVSTSNAEPADDTKPASTCASDR